MSTQQNKKSTANLPDPGLGAPFFERDIHDVARDLVGCELVRHLDQCPHSPRRGRIVEVEVYEGSNDAASHARSGEPTERTAPMFGAPGTIYVYTIYGMYQCLNLRAPSSAGPGAILIRACQPLSGRAAMAVSRGLVESPEAYRCDLDDQLMSGPGKVCQALAIDTDLSGSPIGGSLLVKSGEQESENASLSVVKRRRVGLNRRTCGDSVDWPWRYMAADSPWVSRQ